MPLHSSHLIVQGLNTGLLVFNKYWLRPKYRLGNLVPKTVTKNVSGSSGSGDLMLWELRGEGVKGLSHKVVQGNLTQICLLYTSDAADE